MDRDEPKFAEASREMLQRRDYLVPWFNGRYRFDKPPLIYWCQVGCFKVLGQNAFAARFPSVLFTTATVSLLWFWGRRFGTEKVGLYAALMFACCVQVLIHARLAVADMPMVFFVAMAVWSGWEMTRPPAQTKRWRWWLMFYASLGLGFLAKGPVAWLPLGGVLLARWLRPDDFYIGPGNVISGLMLVLLLIGLWGIPALLATHGQYFAVGIGEHVVYRSFGIMEGHGGPGWLGFVFTLPLYFVTFFVSFFPWALKVPGALRQWWLTRRLDTIGWYLLVQAGLVFAVFTLVRTKLPHYTMPAFPCLSLWLASRVAADHQGCGSWVQKWAVGMSLFALFATLVLFTVARPRFVAAKLWQQSRPFCSANSEFATIEFDEPSLVWEFRRQLTNYMQNLKIEHAASFLNEPGPRILILPTSQFTGDLCKLATNATAFRAVGLDTARFRKIDLTEVIKGER